MDSEMYLTVAEGIGADNDVGEDGDGIVESIAPSGLEKIEPILPERIAFAEYLSSPIIELVLGSDVDAASLYAHQGLLEQSPFFAEACQSFSDTVQQRQLAFPDEDFAATASVIEYLYRDDYFPNVTNKTSLEHDPTVPTPDDDGVGLLRHARVYTLARRFQLHKLAALAHRKIHLTSSTAKGEIAYARFVYKETSAEDETIRKPVAAFWATRSHVLRHEAEQEFRKMCLEFPQFGFDVLSLVLDQQEKDKKAHSVVPSGSATRKRQRLL